MRKPAASPLKTLFLAGRLAEPLVRFAQGTAAHKQADCTALNRLNGDGKFAGHQKCAKPPHTSSALAVQRNRTGSSPDQDFSLTF